VEFTVGIEVLVKPTVTSSNIANLNVGIIGEEVNDGHLSWRIKFKETRGIWKDDVENAGQMKVQHAFFGLCDQNVILLKVR
jgi:hypothetical protein